MPTYNAEQIIGKTLIAKRPVNLYRFADDNAPVIYTVEPGNNVGVVYSYLNPNNARQTIYWTFYDSNNKPYYAPHKTGDYDIKTLSEQGALTVVQQAQQAAEQNLSTTDKVFKLVQKYLLIGAGVYLLNSIIKKKL
jgi:hypothetical protein